MADIMTTYPGREHYQDEEVASTYDAQYNAPIRLWNLRARVYGWCEERTFLHLLRGAPEGGKVLDLPVGTGRYLKYMLDRGHEVGAADISAEMLQVARQRIGRHPGILFFEVADAVAMPHPDGVFDGVNCMRLYHLVSPRARARMLREVRRVGRGWAILYFGMRSPWLDLRRSVRERLIGQDVSDPYPISMRGLRRELDAVGMQLDAAQWVLPWLADGLIVRVSW
jgi:SAM-dependent methyltransferase